MKNVACLTRSVRIGASVFVLLYVANLALAGISSKEVVSRRIVEAFGSGELRDEAYAVGDWRRGVNQFNDCVILQTILLTREQPLVDAVSVMTVPGLPPCQTLRDVVLDTTFERQNLHIYDRYLWGARTVTAAMLHVASLATTRRVMSFVLYAMIVCAVIGGLVRALFSSAPLRPNRRPQAAFLSDNRRFGVSLSVIGIGLIGFYGLHLFARNVGHVYSEIVVASYLLWCGVTGPQLRGQANYRAAALFGAATACFELLTGPVVVGAVLTGLIAIARTDSGKCICRRAWRQVLAYLTAFGTVFLLQQIIAGLLTKRNSFSDFGTHLALRLQLHHVFELHLPDQWQIPSNLAVYGPRDVIQALIDALPLLTYGSIHVAVALSACAILIALAACIIMLTQAAGTECRSRVLAALSMLSIVPVWFVAFGNHTAIHSLYMVRLVTMLWIGCALLLTFVWPVLFADKPVVLGTNSWKVREMKIAIASRVTGLDGQK